MFDFTTVSATDCKPIGAWRLHPGHAMGLCPRKAAVLRVYCGRLWVTLDGPHGRHPNDAGDRFMSPGDVLFVAAGVRAVLESMTEQGSIAPAHFDWGDQAAAPSRFAREVGGPSADFVAALTQASAALAQMAKGLLGCSGSLVVERGKVLSRMASLRS